MCVCVDYVAGLLTQDCVAGLSRLGVGLASVISEELASADNDGDSDENEGECVVKATTAEDFTDITEVSNSTGGFAYVVCKVTYWSR